MITKLTNNKPDKKIAFFIATVFFCLFLTNLSHGLAPVLGLNSEFVPLALKGLIAVMFVLRLNIIISRFNRSLFFFTGLTVLVVVINTVIFPELNEFFLDNAIIFFTLCFLPSVSCYVLNDYSVLYRYLVNMSYIVAVPMFLVLICLLTGVMHSFNNDTYSMSLGYSCLIPAILLSKEISKNNRYAFFGFLVLLISIVLLGSRGPLIGIGMFYLYFSVRSLIQKKKYIKAMILVFATIVMLLVYKPLMITVNTLLANKDMYSRTVALLAGEGDFMADRDDIYGIVIDGIKMEPFKIRGINAEYVIIDSYVHNIVLELVYQLGVVLGGVVLVFVFHRVWKTLALKDLDDCKTICIMFMFASVPAAFVSGTLMHNYIFWMWMAVYSKATSLRQYHRDSNFV